MPNVAIYGKPVGALLDQCSTAYTSHPFSFSYCYVCDIPAKECKTWQSTPGSGGGHYAANHCCATDKVGYWVTLRHNHRRAQQQGQDFTPSGGLHRSDSVANRRGILANGRRGILANGQGSSYSLPSNNLSGLGPFPPSHPRVERMQHLTKCRKCGWFNYFKHMNFKMKSAIHAAGSSKDWCMHCGRVASDKDFAKEKSGTYNPLPTDIVLGEKVIPFRIRAHDPREFDEFKQAWIDGGYTYKAEEMESDVFRHRLGKHPTIEKILESLPIVAEEKIPTTGAYVRSNRSCSGNENDVLADETDAVIIENQNHQKLLHVLQDFVYGRNIGFRYNTLQTGPKKGKKVREFDSSSYLRGDVVAKWDGTSRSGVS